jgi:magnesium transporter
VLTVHPEGPLETAFWIDLFDPTPEEAATVAAATGMAVPSREALSEIETSSRLRTDADVLYLSTPIVSRGDTPEPELTPLGFVLSQKQLVTVRFASLRVMEAAAAEFACQVSPSSVGVFTVLLEAMVDRSADQLESASAELESLSRETFRTSDVDRRHVARSNRTLRRTLGQMGRLGDRLSKIRSSLLGVARLTPYASEVAKAWIAPEFLSRLAAVRADLLSLADYETYLEGRTQFLLDAVLGFINTEQNDLFKILTIVSVVGVPPTLVASIYGMNFAYMPELHWRLGYPYAIAMIVLVTVAPMVWFKWKNWW